MGYRHYVGFIPKQKLEEIRNLSKEEFMKLYGDYDEYFDKYYFSCSVFEKKGQSSSIHCIGKLYWNDTQEIYDTLYKYKLEDFPYFESEDTEFFILKPNNDFFKELAKAYWNRYLKYIEEANEATLAKNEKDRLCKYFKETFEVMFEKNSNPFMLSRSDEYSFMTYNWMYLHKTFDYENNVIYVAAW